MRIADYLDTAAARFPAKEALVFGRVRLTYDEARRQANAVANRLKNEAGLSDKVHVGILSPNDIRIPIIQFGASRADFTWLCLHDRNAIDTNAEILAFLDCDVLFFNSQYEHEIERLRTVLPAVRTWVCIDRESRHAPSFEQWLIGSATDFPYVRPDCERVAVIVPTGGTTGPSKGAVHSQRSLEMQLIFLSSSLGMVEDSRLLTIAPLSHAAGQLALGLLPLGGTNIILKGFDPDLVLRTIVDERITHLFLPPTLIYLLLAHPRIGETDFSSLTHVLVGASPIAPEKFKEALRVFGPVIYEIFAQTETLLPVLFKGPADYLSSDGSIDEEILRTAGRAGVYSRVEIMDDDGNILGAGAPGEIVVRSSMGMTGYYKNDEATRETSAGGYHHTGDIGIRNDRGFVTIIDRKKDMIISGGFNVYPNEVEAVINAHPAVLDCAVVGVPDDKWGEAVKAVVQLKPGSTVDGTELIALCRDRLGGVKAPKTVEIWPDLPRSAVGKMLRREVRKKFWEGRWRAV